MDTAAAPSAPRMVDERAGTNGTHYTLARVYTTDTDTIRVRITRDFYDFQSSAVAEVLNSDRHFTVLATEPTSAWHDNTRCTLATVTAGLGTVADRLLARTLVILG